MNRKSIVDDAGRTKRRLAQMTKTLCIEIMPCENLERVNNEIGLFGHRRAASQDFPGHSGGVAAEAVACPKV